LAHRSGLAWLRQLPPGFDDGQAHFHWDKEMESLLEHVADNLA
jgi:hypothetical protein